MSSRRQEIKINFWNLESGKTWVTGEAMWKTPHLRVCMEMDTAQETICPPEPCSWDSEISHINGNEIWNQKQGG